MSHLDEGTLHALLDGELETHEVAEIQAHLGSCSSCGLRLREVKEFYAEADRLVATVDVDARAPMAAARPTPVPSAPQAEPSARREPTPRPQPPAAAPPKWEPWNEPPPVLLVPDNESAGERRIRRMQRLGWAAILVLIVGAGAVEARKFMPVAGEDVPPPSNAKTVVSQEEAPARDAGTVANPRSPRPTRRLRRLGRSPPRRRPPRAQPGPRRRRRPRSWPPRPTARTRRRRMSSPPTRRPTARPPTKRRRPTRPRRRTWPRCASAPPKRWPTWIGSGG